MCPAELAVQLILILSSVRSFMLHYMYVQQAPYNYPNVSKFSYNFLLLLLIVLLFLPFSFSPLPFLPLLTPPPPPPPSFVHYVLRPESVLNQPLKLPVVHSLDRGSAGCKTCTYTRQNKLRENVDKRLCSECILKPHGQCSSCL